MDDIKAKLLGWISNHAIKTPNNNLPQLELRGRKWILDKITLVMNYIDIQQSIENEIYNENKFQQVQNTASKHLSIVGKEEVQS